jgi:hypothetical protein
MDSQARIQLRTALGILSGRINWAQDDRHLADLGFNVWAFQAYGAPTERDVKARAEEVVFRAIEILYHRTDPEDA